MINALKMCGLEVTNGEIHILGIQNEEIISFYMQRRESVCSKLINYECRKGEVKKMLSFAIKLKMFFVLEVKNVNQCAHVVRSAEIVAFLH